MFDNSDAALIDDPMDRNDANEPTLPIDSTDPTLPIESADPVDPIDRNESRDAIDHFPLSFPGISRMRPSLGTRTQLEGVCRPPRSSTYHPLRPLLLSCNGAAQVGQAAAPTHRRRRPLRSTP